jgi:hypothetical protein
MGMSVYQIDLPTKFTEPLLTWSYAKAGFCSHTRRGESKDSAKLLSKPFDGICSIDSAMLSGSSSTKDS